MDRSMPFHQLLYISILSTACWSLPERFMGGPPHSLQMESWNFQHILTWQAKINPTVPTYYRVLYRDHRNWYTAKQCSNITQLSCSLTDDFKDVHTQYSALVQSFIGTKAYNSSRLTFLPYTDTYLGPPEVNISSCLNCINVTVKLPTSHLRKNGKLQSLIDIYEELDYDITLKTLDGDHKTPRERTTAEIFNTVIEELYPSRNYCVSVMVTASLNKHSIPSTWKCVTADSAAQQDYHTAVIASAVCISLLLVGALKCLHVGGYILQKHSLPRTLVFIRTSPNSFWPFGHEEIASVEILYKEIRKKTNESSGCVSDEDNSDDSDATSNHDYTRREMISRIPQSSDTSKLHMEYCTKSNCADDSSSQASENPGTDSENSEEHEVDIEENDASSELLNTFSERNCSYLARRRNSACFTIKLNTVQLGNPEEDVDSSAALLSSQEDAFDWQHTQGFEVKLLDNTEDMQKRHCPNGSHEWQKSSCSSGESDSSDSDMDQNTEYIRR
ncbi:interferon alpha/beta receptor 2 isoform X2 [Colius striatus]|uniref:interferon alpha/beta receptor 2 isoform X2 n=1 Tax=Colius striatus TaxID=57412 RepID=UPI002B1E545A|nr:interferon alpha/beta receptor 2 isoform X2 [Colius striatus]